MLFPFIFQVCTSKSPLPIKQPVVSQATRSRRWDAGQGRVLQSQQWGTCPRCRSTQHILHKEAPKCECTWLSAGTEKTPEARARESVNVSHLTLPYTGR